MLPTSKNNRKPTVTSNPATTQHTKLHQALAFHQKGQLVQAQAIYEDILKTQPGHSDALHLLGVIAYQTKQHQRAADLISQAIAIHPGNAIFYSNLGNALKDLGQLDDAVASYDKAITIKPDYAEALNNRGVALKDLKQLDEALASYDKAIAIKPDYAEALNNRGNALKDLKQLDAALASYDKAIAIKSDYAEAFNNRGNALKDLRQLDAAVASYDRAITIKPDYAEALNNRGNALKDLGKFDAAMASYDRAIAIRPDYAEAYSNRGNALLQLKQLEVAVTSFERAIAFKPDSEFIYGKLLHTQMHLCAWGNHDASLRNLKRQIEHRKKVSMPFPVLACIDDPNLHKLTAQIWTRAKCPPGHVLGTIKPAGKKNKVRIGYYSADFRNHPVTHLMAGIFELHDKSRFELVAFSFGPNGDDEMRQRVSTAFDQFIDVQNMSDRDAAAFSREMEIDIAVDLSGFTQNSRTGIFAERCAPIQVNYLGYPGTMGAPYMDYIIADKQVIPEENQLFYSEKIAYLPDSYLPTSHQINDSRWQDATSLYTKARFGLPDTGVVFCCFNNNYKITPSTFNVWMRLLERVEGSILWLFEDNPTAAMNLRQAAGQRGVDKNRLIFAKRVPLLSEHLARYRFADLFLDTLPYNAHTTASDALWAGLPVLTCMGQSFASRVAGSLLHAIDLPELITHSQEEYEKLAIELATNPDKLAAIKQKLETNRLTTPLFDSKTFTLNIEAAYTAMYERYHAGLTPDHIEIRNHDRPRQVEKPL